MPHTANAISLRKYRTAFAKRLRLMLVMHDTNAHKLSQACGFKGTQIYNWTAGEALPNAYSVAKMAVALGCDANELLGIRKVDER